MWMIYLGALPTAAKPQSRTGHAAKHFLLAHPTHPAYIVTMQITVQGEASESLAPTRATVTANVQAQDLDPATAKARMSASTAIIHASLSALAETENTPVESWSMGAPTTWTSRPWKEDGSQGSPVHYAQTTFIAVFTNFEAVSEWMEQQSNLDSVELPEVSWGLSDHEHDTVTSRVRALAVRNAKAKALEYARAAQFSSVEFIEIADVGLLNSATAESASYGMMRSAKMDSVTVRPQDITVSASVQARFTAKA